MNMNTLMKIFLFALFVSVVTLPYVLCQQEEEEDFSLALGEEDGEAEAATSRDDSIQLRGIGRLLAQKKMGKRRVTSCKTYPKICRAKGSPGRDCCKNKCVNMRTDRLNCGKCGHKCKYSEICCKGKCVNPMNDKHNCGSCNNECHRPHKHKKGRCVYGMCSYA